MTLSGTIEREGVGSAASAVGAPRTARCARTPTQSLVGTLGGRHVALPASAIATAAIVGSDAQASSHSGSGGSAARCCCSPAGPSSSAAHRALASYPAPARPAFECTTLPVPLDRARSGAGNDLAERRAQARRAPRPSRDAVVALAGGPGPGGAAARANSSPRRSLRRSARATCSCSTSAAPAPRTRSAAPRFETLQRGAARASSSNSAPSELGPARGGFTTQESVAGHRGPAPGRRLRKARPVRHLLRHQGRARVRRTLPAERRSAGARLGRAARNGPGTVRDPHLPGDRRRARKSSAPTAPARGSPPIPLADIASLAAQLRKRAAQRLGLRRLRQAPLEHAQRAGPARHPRGRRPEPGAARAAARRRALGAATTTPTRCCACTCSPRA